MAEDFDARTGLTTIDNKLSTTSIPFLYDVGRGLVSGKDNLRVLGYNGDVDAAVEDLWVNGAAYVPPASAIGMEVVSSSAGDEDLGTSIKSGTADSITLATSTNCSVILTLTDAAVDFSAATTVVAGDVVLLNTDVEWGLVLTVATHVLTVRVYTDITTVVSTQTYSVLDTSAAETGIRAVGIHYLDVNYAEKGEFVILNGNTAVATTATNIIRVNKIHSVMTGSSNAAVGKIDIRALADTPIYRSISIGRNSDTDGFYTVPAGKTAYITKWNVASGFTTNLRQTLSWLNVSADPHGHYTKDTFDVKDAGMTQDNNFQTEYSVPITIPAMADVKVSAACAETNAIVTTRIEGWIE